jgi:hypothetical protein
MEKVQNLKKISNFTNLLEICEKTLNCEQKSQNIFINSKISL